MFARKNSAPSGRPHTTTPSGAPRTENVFGKLPDGKRQLQLVCPNNKIINAFVAQHSNDSFPFTAVQRFAYARLFWRAWQDDKLGTAIPLKNTCKVKFQVTLKVLGEDASANVEPKAAHVVTSSEMTIADFFAAQPWFRDTAVHSTTVWEMVLHMCECKVASTTSIPPTTAVLATITIVDLVGFEVDGQLVRSAGFLSRFQASTTNSTFENINKIRKMRKVLKEYQATQCPDAIDLPEYQETAVCLCAKRAYTDVQHMKTKLEAEAAAARIRKVVAPIVSSKHLKFAMDPKDHRDVTEETMAELGKALQDRYAPLCTFLDEKSPPPVVDVNTVPPDDRPSTILQKRMMNQINQMLPALDAALAVAVSVVGGEDTHTPAEAAYLTELSVDLLDAFWANTNWDQHHSRSLAILEERVEAVNALHEAETRASMLRESLKTAYDMFLDHHHLFGDGLTKRVDVLLTEKKLLTKERRALRNAQEQLHDAEEEVKQDAATLDALRLQVKELDEVVSKQLKKVTDKYDRYYPLITKFHNTSAERRAIDAAFHSSTAATGALV